MPVVRVSFGGMRGKLVLAAVLLGAGCLSTSGVVQYGDLPDGPTPEEQLREILDWADADGSPAALEARQQADTGLRRTTDADADRERISRAWTHARAAARPDLEPQEKERLWRLCANELTHGADGT